MDHIKTFSLYGSESPKQIALHNSSRGENDIRMTYIVEFPNMDKLAVKVTKNSFTTPERVKGWAELIEHYNNLGIYCPKIVRNKNGEYCSNIDGYLVFAEEYMKYKPAAGRNESLTGDQKYERKLYESIGLVAANPAPLVPWHTAYCIYDKFDITDEYDENYQCAMELRDYYRDNIPEHAMRAQKLFEEYCRRREKFEPIYRLLPKSVFQGDINDSNILVDEAGDFKGMIDFNLSGTETILNYAFCESFCCLEDDSEIDVLLDTEALKKRDAWTAQRLAWIGKHYKFTDEEREAFNEYYNIVAPFRWTYHCFFLSLLKNREKYPEGRKYAGHILDWTEYQMTRSDVSSLLP
ncbi:hypothetical protein CDQ84_11910 [Clostridium thermosuccinogenes]|uniref:Aminoglycoside phosphotransferase domain-containing protein n=1 Tax=Clostridium thermosuccinogenes TaxID=84032 RepID=A0A2K2FC92_9CLOT|nr:phosphotransferase [Pseudoclostridium thermosuccinogenes]AUS96227.1 hypothetical protein CDO33_07135 [Pseudoclostridium thermosuccinogenes]PNT96398.1 hypothetical protein CDQ85_11755 [Pseudoclostridium thermosuccinogenes]PNT98051.1 hypothetical protein CDQ84_11910 [Pseudoclostridium thermosuccinogenes]